MHWRARWWLVAIVCFGGAAEVHAADPASAPLTPEEQKARSAAVALNYSRASLHRIRQNPSVRVLMEEQEKILNHLNLNGVADEEVLKLYAAVLDEIAQIRIAEREQQVLHEKYRRALRQGMTVNTFAIATSVATAQFPQAVKTGASSFWDYRNTALNRDLDVWKVEKSRLTAVSEKSTQFLDVSWKMARAKQIPDRWLVRNDDLDRLEAAWKEPDLTTRTRMLKRMEPFMEAYPPYYYYVARTQQQAGQLFAADETFSRLAELETGHFRKDEMLAAAYANQAAIQLALGRKSTAADSARKGLACSTEAWQANLLSAVVLQQAGDPTLAEEAVLRNLDSDLERPQSQAALAGLYYASDNHAKLAAMLSDPAVVAELPTPVLISSAVKLGERDCPKIVSQFLEGTLQVVPRFNFGPDDLIVAAHPAWQLQEAHLTLLVNGRPVSAPRLATQNRAMTASFDGIGEWGHPFGQSQVPAQPVTLVLLYPDMPEMKLTLRPGEPESYSRDAMTAKAPRFRLASLEQRGQLLAFGGSRGRESGVPGPVLASPATPPNNPIVLLAPEKGPELDLIEEIEGDQLVIDEPKKGPTIPISGRRVVPLWTGGK